jgi:hypothetical protein
MSSQRSATRPHLLAQHGMGSKCALALAVAAAFALPAAACGGASLASVDIVTRADARVQPQYARGGERWVVGTPGQEYAVRVCNTTGARVLAVTSVDGVNVVSGDTAAPNQSGYVLDPYQCLDIEGWRKSLARTAAFYFTELPDSYAARTGRPDNVGVIGVALFRERIEPQVWREHQREKIAESRRDAPVPAASPAPRGDGGAYADKAQANAAAPSQQAPAEAKALASDATGRAEMARGGIAPLPAPAPAPQLGTGYGRDETSYAQTTRFERETTAPAQTLAIRYDRRENLVAMGILPLPPIARAPAPNPFPAAPRFVPEPPSR